MQGDPEVVGTIGQLPPDAITLIETVDEIASFVLVICGPSGMRRKMMLSVDDTAHIVAALKAKFPPIHGPHKEDI